MTQRRSPKKPEPPRKFRSEAQPPEEFVSAEPWWRRPLTPAEADEKGRYATVAPTGHKAARPKVAVPRLTLPQITIPPRLIALGVTAGLFFTLLALLLTWEGLAVNRATVTIYGAQQVAAQAIYAEGQFIGANIFWLDPARSARLVRQIPGIADATVHVRLPDHVVVEVREHVPFLVWQGITQTVWLADTGAVIPTFGTPPSLRLVDLASTAAESNGRIKPLLLAQIQELRAAGLAHADLYYGLHEGLYFRSADGWTVYLGREGPMTAKLAILETLKQDAIAARAPARVVDLRFAGMAQIR